jgi:hypothetical protein
MRANFTILMLAIVVALALQAAAMPTSGKGKRNGSTSTEERNQFATRTGGRGALPEDADGHHVHELKFTPTENYNQFPRHTSFWAKDNGVWQLYERHLVERK